MFFLYFQPAYPARLRDLPKKPLKESQADQRR
jgi:hypothetical protein